MPYLALATVSTVDGGGPQLTVGDRLREILMIFLLKIEATCQDAVGSAFSLLQTEWAAS